MRVDTTEKEVLEFTTTKRRLIIPYVTITITKYLTDFIRDVYNTHQPIDLFIVRK